MKNSDDFETKISRGKLEPKGWGVYHEGWFARIGELYAYHHKDEARENRIKAETVKVLYFSKDKKLSLHFHGEKEEIFLCAYGEIELEVIKPSGLKECCILTLGDRVFIPKLTPHRMRGLKDLNILIEVSTHHEDSDSFRIEKGD